MLSGPERRRRWTSAEKHRIVEESLAADATVIEVARRHDIHPNLLHFGGDRHVAVPWRRWDAGGNGVQFASIAVAMNERVLAAPPGVIEIEFASGTWLRITGSVDAATVSAAIAGARGEQPRSTAKGTAASYRRQSFDLFRGLSQLVAYLPTLEYKRMASGAASALARRNHMREYLKKLTVGAITGLAVGGVSTVTATCAEILQEADYTPRREVYIHRGGRLVAPAMIGGFALGAATHTYRARIAPLYVFDYWFRDCTPRPRLVGYTARNRAIVKLVGACP